MLVMSNILLATDFSACAQGASTEARRLADAHGARLHMLHVTSPTVPASGMASSTVRESSEATGVAGREDAGGGRVIQHLAHSDAVSRTILDYAAKLEVDLIVMGSHGRRGVRRWLLGSVAEEVVRDAGCPVLVTRNGGRTDEGPGYHRILAPLDFSNATSEVLGHAQSLAAPNSPTLDLLHVIEIPVYPDFYIAMLAEPENRREALERLTRLGRECDPHVEVRVEVRSGRVADEICDFAAQRGHDIIVLASHGYSGLKRLALGRTAEAVVRSAPCPVLVLRSGGRNLAVGSLDTANAARAS